MKVLLRTNVAKLGHVGEVVEVRPGYARNYLLPQLLAVEPTEANIKAIETEKAAYLERVAKERAELEVKADALQGKEITLAARANEEGHLYGSIGPAQLVAALAEQQIFIEPENIKLDEPIRRLDKYDIEVRFAEDIKSTIHVWVVPIHDDEGEGEPGEEGDVEAAPAEEADTAVDTPADEGKPDVE